MKNFDELIENTLKEDNKNEELSQETKNAMFADIMKKVQK